MNTLFRKEQSIYGPRIPLLNSGNWNPDLHPRNSIGEFTYTDGGRHGESTPDTISKPGQKIIIPPHPPGVDINFNMKIAWNLGAKQNPLVALKVFKLLVQTGGPWDYKNQPTMKANLQYDAFGNFNYGATGTALGLTSIQLQSMAGLFNTSDGSGIPFISPPYGDRTQDNYQIQQGIAYAHSQGY